MVAVSLLQVKKWRWGNLSQISQGKLSAPKYCEFSDENTGPQKKSGMNFTCEYTTTMDFEPLNPNPVSEFPLDPQVFP